MAFPAIAASSWLSLISTLMTWTGRFSSPPRLSRSRDRIDQLGGSVPDQTWRRARADEGREKSEAHRR